MEEEQTGIEAKFDNPVAMYFSKVTSLGEREPDFLHASNEVRDTYQREIRTTYDVLYDRIMTTDMSHFLKQEVEQWYGFNRDFLGFMNTQELNEELGSMLSRFNLI
jgi:hypothetical protein